MSPTSHHLLSGWMSPHASGTHPEEAAHLHQGNGEVNAVTMHEGRGVVGEGVYLPCAGDNVEDGKCMGGEQECDGLAGSKGRHAHTLESLEQLERFIGVGQREVAAGIGE